jgi:DNA mismatch repair ATPase MutS
MITGTNQGGKSTLLRSLGVAQLMLQAGLFAPATGYRASVATALHSHYRREEDPGMQSGKLDEELARMSRTVDLLTPHSVVLLNESFAATNEREGSHIARQVVDGLRAADIRVLYVTHLYDLAAGLAATGADQAVFLRPERLPNTERTYRVVPGAPQPTSYGPDLYRRIFGDTPADSAPPAHCTPVGTEAR